MFPTDKNPSDNETNTIHAYFTSMSRMQESINYAEYLNMAHKQHINNKDDEKSNDHIINLSDYIPEPKSLYQILKLSDHIKDKWGTAIKKEIDSLFDNGAFDTNERALPADEVIPVKCAFKTKLNAYGGLDKLKARICIRGHMQIKDQINNWSPTASV